MPPSIIAQEAEESKLLVEGAEALPPHHIQMHLAEVFFDHVYGQAYHVLHKPSYVRKLKQGALPPVIVLAVCAISARFSTHPEVNTSPAFLRGEQWAAEAQKIVLARYDRPNITILTCLLLLGLHEFGTCYGGRSWMLGGMAIRMAYALQLHKDLEYDPTKPDTRVKLSFIDREIRRRTMWACFLMDRFNSSGTDRPMFIKEETIQVQLPIMEKMFQLDMEGPTEDLEGNVLNPSDQEGSLSHAKENMGVAAYMIRSLALWGRTVIYHFQGGRDADPHKVWEPDSVFHQLKQQTEELITNLPDTLKYTPDNLTAHDTEGLANQFLFLHITTQQNIMLLNHNATLSNYPSRKPRVTPPPDFVAEASQTALHAAKCISDLLRVTDTYPIQAPFAGYCAFLSSTVQMRAAFSRDEAVASVSKRNLATNVRYLTKMKRYWGAFHWTSEQLKKQFTVLADAAKRTGTADGAETRVANYGDWYDKYPHGVSKSDFDPVPPIKKEKGEDAVLAHTSDLRSVEQFCKTATANKEPADATKGKKRQKKSTTDASPAVAPQPQPQPQQINTKAPSTTAPQQQLSQPTPTAPVQIQHQSLPINIAQQVPQQNAQPFHATHLSPHAGNFTPQAPQQGLYSQDMHYAHQLGIPPQLDYTAFSGMDITNPAASGMSHPVDLSTLSWDMNNPSSLPRPTSQPNLVGLNTGMGGMQADGMVGVNSWGQPTSAWFMPWNTQPPVDMGESEMNGVWMDDGMGIQGQGYGLDMGMDMGGMEHGSSGNVDVHGGNAQH
jgi:hypothetical protein